MAAEVTHERSPDTPYRILWVHAGDVHVSRNLTQAGLFWYSQDIPTKPGFRYWIIYDTS